MIPQRLANAGLAAWVLADAARILVVAGHPEQASYLDLALCGVLVANAAFALLRPAARVTAEGAAIHAGVWLAVFWPLLFGLAPHEPQWGFDPALPATAGVLLLAWTVPTLRTNFSVLPQLRTVTRSGPYRFVRHPMYTAYLLIDFSIWVAQGSPASLAIWAGEWLAFWWRARLEERVLLADPDYAGYMQRVRRRFLPHIL